MTQTIVVVTVAFEAEFLLNQITLIICTRAYRITTQVYAGDACQAIIGSGLVRIVAGHAFDRAAGRLLRVHDGRFRCHWYL